MESKTVKVGVIGCGNISPVYFEHLCNYFDIVELAACADLDMARAAAKADELNDAGDLKYPGVKAMTVDELLADQTIEIVVNLTIPKAHYEVSLRALQADKHVYSEKPLAITRREGKALLAEAKERNLLIGNAPDTFLGESHQTARKLIDDGWIGQPVSATAFMTCHGHESWHPDPEFYYKIGGGPMFDMGPYYLTDLVFLMGPVQSVCGMTSRAFEQRTVTSKKKFGLKIDVEVPTHITGVLRFANGVVCTVVMSFDVWKSTLPRIEIHGTEGSLSVPDPNCFDGEVKVFKPGYNDWQLVPLTYRTNGQRGKGVADMAYAVRTGRPYAATGELAYHVLDVMHALHESDDKKRFIDIQSSCDQPGTLPMNSIPGTLELISPSARTL